MSTSDIPTSQSPDPLSQQSESSPQGTMTGTIAGDQPSASNNEKAKGGPLNLEQIRKMREGSNVPPRTHRQNQQVAQEPRSTPNDRTTAGSLDSSKQATESANESAHQERKESSQSASAKQTTSPVANDPTGDAKSDGSAGRRQRSKSRRDDESADSYTASASVTLPKVERPNLRHPLSTELEQEFESAFMDADLNGLMIGAANTVVGREFEPGTRYRATLIKIHNDSVFMSLGGPDEGVVPLLQFLDYPKEGDNFDVLIRGFNNDDGLYELALPGEAVSVEDWADIQDGAVVEAIVESANTGGLECKVGGIRGFIPMRHISEFRIEETASYIGQRLLCTVLEANPSRGNLVLSHRAILERERAEKKSERLANLTVGDVCEGIVRKIMDFGAFVDIGGLDGLVHISQLSWDKIKHPSEVVKEGETISVRIEKIDPDSGKIGLSYRHMQTHPWATVETEFPVGSVVKGAVSRIANFGAFVKLAPGIEGLIHVSELAHRRIANVESVVHEGQEVEVKVLSVDREAQRMSLSMKAIIEKPEAGAGKADSDKETTEEPKRAAVVAKHRGPLKGGTSNTGIGERFGLKW